MKKRVKKYKVKMSEEDFMRLEELSRKLNMSKSKVIRYCLRSADMSLIIFEEHREKIKNAYRGGYTHAVYKDTDSIKLTKGD